MVDAVADHLAALPAGPVWQPLPDDLRAALLGMPLPDGPTGLEALAQTMARDVLPHAMGNGHPAFFGWVNPPPALAGVLASLPAAAMNPSVVSGDLPTCTSSARRCAGWRSWSGSRTRRAPAC